MPGDASIHRFGPFELNLARGCLFREGKPVRLSGQQFAVLARLAASRGQPVPKGALVSAAWNGMAIGDNSLEKTISRLRVVLGKGPGGLHYIETIKQHGYRLTVPVERVESDLHHPLDAQLEPFLVSVESSNLLDTLDRAEVHRARATLEAALRQAPDYGRAHMALAMACGFAFEASILDAQRDVAVLEQGVSHARRACELLPSSGEAWATLAFVDGLAGRTAHAAAAANKAILLEPENWRHALRLAHVTWGEERVQAARRVLVLCPGLALAHWLRATVFIGRAALDTALEEIVPGCAAQDGQTQRSPFKAVGLHLLHGLVLAAQGRLDAALTELMLELPSADSGQIYARECAANTWYAIGAVRWRQHRRDEAAAAFERALAIAPAHAPARAAYRGVIPATAHRMDRALAQSILLARGNRHRDAASVFREALVGQPPGPAGWILAVEPFLNPLAQADVWTETLALVRVRAT
jgi:DNA-binding winged helix-turn-helix (wHTH) protein